MSSAAAPVVAPVTGRAGSADRAWVDPRAQQRVEEIARPREAARGRARTLDATQQRDAAAELARPQALDLEVVPDDEGDDQVRRPPTRRPEAGRKPSTLRGVHVGQVVACEVAIVGGVVGYPQPIPLMVPMLSAAGILLVLSVVRVRGRWLYEWLGLGVRFRSRRRRASSASTDAGPTVMASVGRGVEVTTVEVDGAEVAMISHAGGYTAVLEPKPDAGERYRGSVAVIPPLSDLLPPQEDGDPVLAVQVIIHTVPAQTLVGGDEAIAMSYRELNRGAVPARRQCWIAVQAQHTADDHSDADLHVALVNAVRRIHRRLRKSGLQAHVLSREDAIADVLALVRLEPPTPDAGQRTTITERWRTWNTAETVHSTFRVVDWPELSGTGAVSLADQLVSPSTLSTTVAVAARRRGERMELEAAVRLAVPDRDSVAQATKELEECARSHGARVRRLDGEQVFGVGASLPLGGFIS